MKPVNRILVITTVLMSSIHVNGQHLRHDIKAVVDSVILKARNTSLYSHEVKWDSIIPEIHKHTRHAKTVKDLKPAFEILLNSLKDQHGRFINAADQSSLANFTAWPEGIALNTNQNIDASNHHSFEYKLLEGGIGYLKITAAAPDADIQKEAAIIRSAVDSLEKDEVQKWIIDLRFSHGTNSLPMLAGIAPLIGEGQIGGLVDGKSRIRKLFEIHNGNFYDDQKLVAKFPCIAKINDSKIAVLIGRNTVSAGEVIAIAFKERKNTKFFGEPTFGNAVATNRVRINDNLIMSLTESLYMDRMGHVHSGNVSPDIMIDSDPTEDPLLDNAVTQASEWLQGNNSQ